MKKQVSLKKNFLMNAILTMSQFIFPLITFPYVSRILLPAGTGRVSMATSVISYFSMFAQLGIPTYGVRACAKVRDDKAELSRVVQELLLINLVTVAASYLAFFAVLFAVPRFRADKWLYLIVSVTIFLNAVGIEWMYKGLELYTYITVRSVIFKFIALACMFALVHSQSDYVVYGAITVLAASASNIMNMINARKYIFVHRMRDLHFKRHLRAILIFFAMSCATTVYTNLDTVMLGLMKTDTDVGYYNAAVKIKSILVSIVTSLGAVILPRASYYVENGQMERFREITGKALRFILVFSMPLALYFMMFARQGIFFLSGENYAGSILPMQIIMPTLFLIGFSNILGIQVLVPTGREKIVLYSEICGAVTDLLINALLIPGMASSGAAIGTLAAEAVVLLVQFAALRGEIISAFRVLPYKRTALAMAVAAAGSWWTVRLHLVAHVEANCFLILVISALLFFGIYFVLMYSMREPLAKEGVAMVRAKLRKRRAK